MCYNVKRMCIKSSPLGEGRGGGAGCWVVVGLFGFLFSFCKVNQQQEGKQKYAVLKFAKSILTHYLTEY